MATTTIKMDRRGIPIDDKGYVASAQCNVNHSGNRRLAWNVRAYACQGCSTFYSVDEVRTPRHAEYTGGGGVAAR